jgi:hypothetical protein
VRGRARVFHDGRRFERVEDEGLYERVEEDEEVVESDEEVILEDEEVVEGDEEVVGRPRGGPVAEYLYGLTDALPTSLGEWSVPRLLGELRRAEALGDQRRARRAVRLIYTFCPAKPSMCPMYSLTLKCPYGLERRCRGFARAEERRIEKPRKWRSWYREGGSGGR